MDKKLVKLGSGTVHRIDQVYGDDTFVFVLNCGTRRVNPFEFEVPMSQINIARGALDSQHRVDVWGSVDGVVGDRQLKLSAVETVIHRGRVVNLTLTTDVVGIDSLMPSYSVAHHTISNMQEALRILYEDTGATVEIVRSHVPGSPERPVYTIRLATSAKVVPLPGGLKR